MARRAREQPGRSGVRSVDGRFARRPTRQLSRLQQRPDSAKGVRKALLVPVQEPLARRLKQLDARLPARSTAARVPASLQGPVDATHPYSAVLRFIPDIVSGKERK